MADDVDSCAAGRPKAPTSALEAQPKDIQHGANKSKARSGTNPRSCGCCKWHWLHAQQLTRVHCLCTLELWRQVGVPKWRESASVQVLFSSISSPSNQPHQLFNTSPPSAQSHQLNHISSISSPSHQYISSISSITSAQSHQLHQLPTTSAPSHQLHQLSTPH